MKKINKTLLLKIAKKSGLKASKTRLGIDVFDENQYILLNTEYQDGQKTAVYLQIKEFRKILRDKYGVHLVIREIDTDEKMYYAEAKMAS